MFGKLYNERFATVGALSVFIGFCLTFVPQFLLGNMGMPRRYYSYPAHFQWLHVLSTGGAFLLGGALLLALGNLLWALKWGAAAPDNPWDSRSFEWLTDVAAAQAQLPRHAEPRLRPVRLHADRGGGP